MTRPAEPERGAAGVIIGLMMLALIGVGAVAVDVGQIYAERAQLQNGADAGAMAVAHSCQVGTCNSTLATGLANANSNDGASNVKSVDLSVKGQVTVTTTTRNGSSSFLTKMFASALSAGPATVGATATASWGSPGSGPATLPLAFAPCQFDVDGSLHTITTQGSSSCVSDNPSGATIPGGFAWLASDPGKCQATVYPDDPATSGVTDPYSKSGTGNNAATACKDIINSLLNTVVLFPVYSDPAAQGAGGKYYIKGYAAFMFVGYWFPGIHGGDTTGLNGSNNGIRGRFVSWVADPAAFSGGGYSGGGVNLPPHLSK
jgi:hypothetical protein